MDQQDHSYFLEEMGFNEQENYEEYVMAIAAMERVEEIKEMLTDRDYSFDEIESLCIAVLDSEFMNYPDGLLEQLLADYLDEVYRQKQEDAI